METGKCRDGERCTFAHGSVELRSMRLAEMPEDVGGDGKSAEKVLEIVKSFLLFNKPTNLTDATNLLKQRLGKTSIFVPVAL